jgi:hypothetical protein
MAIAPKSDILNVFGLYDPKHVFNKLGWELQTLMESGSVWTDNNGQPVSMYGAFNTAVTAWHMSDWLWHSSPEVRDKLKKRFKLNFSEGTKNQLHEGLKRFQDAVTMECRALYICREIANGSKHMRTSKVDANIHALVEWHPAIEAVGLVKPGDLVPDLTISDHGKKQDAVAWFIEAFGFWEKLFTEEKLVSEAPHVPDIIRTEQKQQAIG